MPNEATIIKAKENKDGKVIVSILGTDYDATKKLKDGIARLSIFGKDYEIHAKKKETAKKSKTIKVVDKSSKATSPTIEFIATDIK